ncbi:MAG: dTMP kinase [Candidatus Fischerbacteria bacterium RBG_13_37_8]|uniref:Thymidylate kinase n=1 Tax=Candidatus Fischerbacteria bacterium RBG_13_37_8 TaxID=1817863 RepID=A0A1F5VGL7_9BACT|nr:MAG: dTMP kinase [Candidatus Fischerbacteria bacterium RBG_13_37_8]
MVCLWIAEEKTGVNFNRMRKTKLYKSDLLHDDAMIVFISPLAVSCFVVIIMLIMNITFIQSQDLSPERMEALSMISHNAIDGHLKFLSSDLLEGRGTGQRGGKLAAEYIASQYKVFGLKEIDELGGYFQNVPLTGITAGENSTFKIGDMQLLYLQDYVMNNQYPESEKVIDADMVFVGYGIVASEYGWNDYKGKNVDGKIVLIKVNEPQSEDEDFFEGKALTYYGRWTYKCEEAVKWGASGVILIHTEESAGYNWEVVRNSWGREQFYLPIIEGEKRLHMFSWITEEKAIQLFEDSGMDYNVAAGDAESKDFIPVQLPLRVTAEIYSAVRNVSTANVIGYIPGKDKNHVFEPVIFTSHYDHLGIGASEEGDTIYNGAVDNASGVSVLLELARIFSLSRESFKRPLVFIAMAAEEDGLRGSEYYVKNPLFPPSRTAANINIDAVSVWGPAEEITFLGADKSGLIPVAKKIAQILNIRIAPDAHPDKGTFFRSDHFNFVKMGIPCMYIKQGRKISGKSKEWCEQKAKEYSKHNYHRPSDEYHIEWNLDGAVQVVKIAYLAGIFIAEMPELPARIRYTSTKSIPPIPSPQSPVPSPQSPIPSPQSPIPSPQFIIGVKMSKGFLIALEGIEGCGKSTQIKKLAPLLETKNLNVIVTYQPGATRIGSAIRNILLSIENKNIDYHTELFLYLADRAQHLHEIIYPNYQAGNIILCDRYYYSTVVYQGFARNIKREAIDYIHNLLPLYIKADITFILDISVEESLRRTAQRMKKHNEEAMGRFEQEHYAFHATIKEAYLRISRENPDSIHIIDGMQDEDSITEAMMEHLERVDL